MKSQKRTSGYGRGKGREGEKVRVVKEDIPTADLGPNSDLFLGSLREGAWSGFEGSRYFTVIFAQFSR